MAAGPPTERLYYRDSYGRAFRARVLAHEARERGAGVVLDRTLFYPTSGGQPFDRGTLGGRAVVEVVDRGGAIEHVLDAPLGGSAGEVDGEIDWARRFDHMQQHSGQHVLSQACRRELGATTVSFHLGEDASTIDLDRADLTWAELARAEAAANDVVYAAAPVRVHLVAPEELARFDLRKPTDRAGEVRLVEVVGYDVSACGGTHVASTAEIGQIKLRRLERRGQTQRVEFVCGRRALADHRVLTEVARALTDRLRTRAADLPEAVGRLQAERAAIEDELAEARGRLLESEAAELVRAAAGSPPLVVSRLEGRPVEAVRRLAGAVAQAGAIALLGLAGDRPQLVVARPADHPADAAALLRAVVGARGGRGGGSPALAQGSLGEGADLDEALEAARRALGGSAG